MRISPVGIALAVSLGAFVADASAQNATYCVKPWAVPDKWIDNHDETEPIDQIWTPDDTFETVDAHGNPLPDADVYNPFGPGSGFTVPEDIGRHLTLRAGNPSTGLKSGSFLAVDIGGAGGGGNAYRTAIATCQTTPVFIGDLLPLISGNMHGPTVQGVADLIALDPDAVWNETTNQIEASCAPGCSPISPRIAVVAVFDPALFEQTRSTSGGPLVRVTNLIGVFVDGIVNGTVTGYFTLVPGPIEP